MKIDTEIYPNGFHFVHQKTKCKLPICSIHLFCDVGSSYETDELRGVAHLLEHMLFQGTKSRSSAELFRQYDRIGTEFNAYTTKRYTCFFVKCHIDSASDVLDLFADVMRNSNLDPKQVSKEAHVVKQETLNRMSDHHVLAQTKFDSVIYKNSSFEQPIDAYRYHQDTMKVTAKALKEWYQWFYRPSNMVLSVVSPNPTSYWKQMIFKTCFVKELFQPEDAKLPSNAIDFPIQGKIPYRQEVDVIITKDKTSGKNAHLVLGFRTVSQYSDKKHVFALLCHVLNGMSGRLFTILRQENSLAYNATASSEEEEFSGYIAVSTEVDHRNLKEAVSLIIKLYEDLFHDGITEEEYRIAQSRVRGQHTIMYENSDTFAKYNGVEHLLFVRDTSNPRERVKKDIVPFEKLVDTYAEITMDHINALIREYFRPQNMVLSVVSPKSISLATAQSWCKPFMKKKSA